MRVDASAVGWAVDEEEGCVDSAALAGVAGLRITELEMLGDVVARQDDRACGPGEERLGHSSISITMDRYSHVIEGMDRAAAEAVAALIEQSSG
jgi:hypothetical protein